jgi:hypothetical protein
MLKLYKIGAYLIFLNAYLEIKDVNKIALMEKDNKCGEREERK